MVRHSKALLVTRHMSRLRERGIKGRLDTIEYASNPAGLPFILFLIIYITSNDRLAPRASSGPII